MEYHDDAHTESGGNSQLLFPNDLEDDGGNGGSQNVQVARPGPGFIRKESIPFVLIGGIHLLPVFRVAQIPDIADNLENAYTQQAAAQSAARARRRDRVDTGRMPFRASSCP